MLDITYRERTGGTRSTPLVETDHACKGYVDTRRNVFVATGLGRTLGAAVV